MEMTKVQKSNTSQLFVRMQNMLNQFEELLLDNTILKVHNHALEIKNPKWKEWWQTIQEFMEDQIQEKLEMV
jgi:hypothetical protein